MRGEERARKHAETSGEKGKTAEWDCLVYNLNSKWGGKKKKLELNDVSNV